MAKRNDPNSERKITEDSIPTVGVPYIPDFGDFVSANDAAMDAFVSSGEAVLKGVVSINEQLMKFADKRTRESIGTCQSMVKCATFAEAMELQSTYARTTTEDYLAQASTLLNLSAKMAREGLTNLQLAAEEARSTQKE